MTESVSMTVVILTYNSADTIAECLESLVAQDYTDFDVVVVDDASEDETLAVAARFDGALRLRCVPNGSHNISTGRNIGIRESRTQIVAFIDSDDAAAPQWTRSIWETFLGDPQLALISGPIIPMARSKMAKAIGVNDWVVKELIGKGIMRCSAGNSAVNQRFLTGKVFNENFRFGEDLELVSRLGDERAFAYVDDMKILHSSRESLREYARQMYRYGSAKLEVGYRFKSYRWLDFVPLGLVAGSVVVAATTGPWWIAFSILPFSLLEAIFTVVYGKRPGLIALSFPAWLTKNVAWSAGIVSAAAKIVGSPRERVRLQADSAATSAVPSAVPSGAAG